MSKLQFEKNKPPERTFIHPPFDGLAEIRKMATEHPSSKVRENAARLVDVLLDIQEVAEAQGKPLEKRVLKPQIEIPPHDIPLSALLEKMASPQARQNPAQMQVYLDVIKARHAQETKKGK